MKNTIKILLVLFIILAISFPTYAQQQIKKELAPKKIPVKFAAIGGFFVDFRQKQCPCRDVIEADGGILLKDARVGLISYNKNIIQAVKKGIKGKDVVNLMVRYKILKTRQIQTVNLQVPLRVSRDSSYVFGYKNLKPGWLLLDKTFGVRFYIEKESLVRHSCVVRK